jgi:hypothetical protein
MMEIAALAITIVTVTALIKKASGRFFCPLNVVSAIMIEMGWQYQV